MKKIFSIFICFVCLLGFVGCKNKKDPTPVPAKTQETETKPTEKTEPTVNPTPEVVLVESITLDGTNEVEVGYSTGISATVNPTNATNREVIWSSSDETIARVDQDGKVMGLKEGTVTITCKAKDASGIEASVEFTVTPAYQEVLVSSISISGATKVEAGKTITLSASVSPSDATNKTVAWESSDATIATVDAGVVTGVKEGSVTITCKALDGSNVTATLEITVKPKPKEDPTDIFLIIGGVEYNESDIIEVTELDVIDLDFRYVPAENVSTGVDMSVSNERYAYLNDDNQLVCVEPGSFALIVYATYGDVQKTYVFKVLEKHYDVETVEVSAPYSEFEETFDCKLNAIITPAKASQEVTWASSDEAIATVSEDGVVTGLKAGAVTITATSTDDPTKTGTIELTVKELVPFDRSKLYVNASYTNFGETVTVDGVELTVGKNALATLADAFKVAFPGAKIYLAAGTYEGALEIDKEVQLIGPNKGINGNGERKAEAEFNGLVTITADGVVLDGLKLVEKASVRVGADNVTLKNLIINASPTKCNGNNRCACIVDYSPANSGMGDGSEYINNLTVKNCKIVVPGTTWGYLSNYMSFTKINNLYVTGNYISNEGTNPGTAGEGIMVYYMTGDLLFKNNVFEYATSEYLMKIAYFSTDCKSVEIVDNVFGGRGNLPTGTIGIIKNSQNTNVNIMHNTFINVNGSGGTLSFETSNANAHINVAYNLFDESTPFGIIKTANKVIVVDNNCYLGGVATGNLYGGPTVDTTTYATKDALEEAYEEYLKNNATPVDTSVVYVDPDLDEEDETHFYTLAKAYEAVEDGGTIRVAAGTYSEEIVWNKKVTVIGPNESINANGERRSEAIYSVPVDKSNIAAPVEFIGLTIQGVGGGATTSGVYFQTTSSLNGDVLFLNCIVKNMNTFVKFNAGSYNLTVEGCKFDTIGQFILWIMNGNNDVKFIDNYVLSNTCGAVVNANASLLRIRSGNAYVYNNTFIGNSIAGDGLFENGVSGNTYEVKYNCFFDVTTYVHNNGGNAILFDHNLYSVNSEILSATPDEAKAPGVTADTTVYASVDALKEAHSEKDHPAPAGVSIRVSSGYASEDATHFKTIKNALASAKEGDVIYVYPGKYTDTLTIDKNNISIIGYNYDLELVHTDKFTSDASIHTIISGKINISSGVSNLTLKGFVSGGQITVGGVAGINISHMISVSPTYDWSLDGCIRINGETSDVEIDHFYISGNCPNRGIHINAKVTNFSITDSAVLDGTSTMYDFLRFSQSSNISTAYGTIIMKNCYVDGIQSGFMDRVPAGTTYVIEGNYFKNVRCGIAFLDVEGGKETQATITIKDNTFDGCGDIENKWDVLQVLSGNETDIKINNNNFLNSFPNGESNDYYIINVFQGLGTIDCSGNHIDKDSQKEKTNNATGITWIE